MKLRTFNLLLALAFVATFGETFHFALVDHHFCAAHGALEHGQEVSGSDAHETHGPVVEASVTSRDHAHTDCLLARSPKVLEAVAQTASLESITAPVLGELRSAFLALDLLQLAPKLSPPA